MNKKVLVKHDRIAFDGRVIRKIFYDDNTYEVLFPDLGHDGLPVTVFAEWRFYGEHNWEWKHVGEEWASVIMEKKGFDFLTVIKRQKKEREELADNEIIADLLKTAILEKAIWEND
jgi:hypothetical protein